MIWTIHNYSIYSEETSLSLLSAAEVYALAFGSSQDKALLDHDLPGISFSKFEARAKFYAVLQDEGQIKIEVVITKGKRSWLLPIDGSTFPDQVVFDKKWYFFTSSHNEMLELMDKAGISAFGPITLTAYCDLIQLCESSSLTEINTNVLTELRQQVASKPLASPAGLLAHLYPYQHIGYSWIKTISEQANGCLLADEMGLGKTLQVIAFLLAELNEGKGPSLVVAPVSLLENWKREIKRFAPSINCSIHSGMYRTGFYEKLLSYDVVITSYGTCANDLAMLSMVTWDVVVLDEAQNIKNPESQRARSVKELPRRFSLAVSGTPFENHMSDVWSLFDFILPKFLGEYPTFLEMYPDDIIGAADLEPVITPFILRRRVSEVAKDLPDRVDSTQSITMEPMEVEGYNALRDTSAKGEIALEVLQRLRLYCTHPFISDEETFSSIQSSDPLFRQVETTSAKYRRLVELLQEIISLREKVLLFTSFVHMFDILDIDLRNRFGVPVYQIDGRTPAEDRQLVVDEFSLEIGPAIMILNPQAAGTGLNITAANHVIHYNLEWNPAKEDQASARAYRRGQTSTVFVYRLYYVSTVEEIILNKMNAKREMSENAIIGIKGDYEANDIINALQMNPIRSMHQ
ncbi:MAG: DEAD/DEAH box helicase [Raoultibacter sp.]